MGVPAPTELLLILAIVLLGFRVKANSGNHEWIWTGN